MMGMQFVLMVSIIFNCYQFGADKKNDERAIVDLRQYLCNITHSHIYERIKNDTRLLMIFFKERVE